MSMTIKLTPLSVCEGWSTVEEWLGVYTETEVVEMLSRYMEGRERMKKYHAEKEAKTKLMGKKLAEIAKEKGLTVEQLVNGTRVAVG